MDLSYVAFLPIVGIALLFVVGAWFQLTRSHSLLAEWAKREGCRIVGSEKCWFQKGPFFWTTGKGQDVYYVSVVDAHGHERRGWVRVGGLFVGMLSDYSEVSWET